MRFPAITFVCVENGQSAVAMIGRGEVARPTEWTSSGVTPYVKDGAGVEAVDMPPNAGLGRDVQLLAGGDFVSSTVPAARSFRMTGAIYR